MIAAWMLYATVVGACLGLAALVAERAFRIAGQSTRWGWVVTSVLSIGIVVVAYVTGPVGAGLGLEPAGAAPIGEALAASAPPRWAIEVPTWWSVLDTPLLVGWTAASVMMFALFVGVSARLRREARGWAEREFDGRQVRVAPNIGPGVFGLFQPCVVMPSWACELDLRARHLILTHELEHVRAGDIWLSHFALLMAGVMPWNMALWWQSRRLRDAIEVDCDRRVLARGVDRHEYGALLVRVCRRTARRPILIAAMSEPRSRLGRRIVLMTASSALRFRWPVALGLGSLAVALVVVSCETPTPPSQLAQVGPTGSDTVLVRIDRGPERINSPIPRYPEMLRQAGIEGKVVLSFVVTEDGSVDASSIEVVEASNRAFVGPSRDVIARSQFEPARADGTPISMRVSQSVTFEIQAQATKEPGVKLVPGR